MLELHLKYIFDKKLGIVKLDDNKKCIKTFVDDNNNTSPKIFGNFMFLLMTS